jgi:CRISPR system Cascade subunit CasE
MKVFPDHLGSDPRKKVGVLHRIDEDRRRGELVLFLQSAEKPDFSRLPSGYFASITDDLDRALAGETDNPRVRSVAREREGIAVNDRFVFRLQANTTKKILTKSLSDGTKQNGKRVPVRGDEERLKWLSRRAAQGGFRVEAVRISEVHLVGDRAKDDSLSFAGAIFDGALSVTDAAAFRAALETGIGPAKAFGFGLLSLSRARKE